MKKTRLKKNKILAVQTVQIGMQTVSMLLLGGITGAISNVLCCLRNLFCFKEWLTWPVKGGFIAVQFVLTMKFNTQGALGWLPFWVCAIYIVLMDVKDQIQFKILSTVSFIPWVVYYLAIRSYTGAFFAALTTITSTIALVSMIKEKKNGKLTDMPEGDCEAEG
jgi:uncharacterized membrane protein